MRLLAVVPFGVFLTFVLLAAGEETAMNLRNTGARLPYFEAVILFPLVTLIVGSLVGLLARNKALLAAVLVFAPCAVSVLLKAGREHQEFSWWLILVSLVSTYCAFGTGAAVYVGRRMNRSAVPNS